MFKIWKRHMTLTEAIVTDATGSVKAVWFNQPYLLVPQKRTIVCLAGKLIEKKNGRYLSNPMYEKIRESYEREEDYTHTGRLVPVYPETAGVSSPADAIKPLLNGYAALPDPLPENILDIKLIHAVCFST